MTTLDEFRQTHLYHYLATVRQPIAENVHDGDTFTVELDFGLDKVDRRFRVRPIGYNAPEVVGTQRADGLAAKEFLIALFTFVEEHHGRPYVALQTVVSKNKIEQMTFSRYLARVWLPDKDGHLRELSDMMLDAGFGE